MKTLPVTQFHYIFNLFDLFVLFADMVVLFFIFYFFRYIESVSIGFLIKICAVNSTSHDQFSSIDWLETYFLFA